MLLLILQLFSISVSARELRFQDCVELVKKNNPDLAAATSNLESTDALVKGSFSNFAPSLTGTMNDNFYFPGRTTSSALTLSYNLFSGFRDIGKLKQSTANRNIAQANLDLTRAKISDSLRQAFSTLEYAKAYAKLTETIKERRAQNERLVRAQYESGRENQGSYLLSQSLLEQAEYDLHQAKDQIVIAARNLAHVLGEDGTEIDISGSVPSAPPEPSIKAEKLMLLTPTHRSQDAQTELSEANLSVSRSGFFPSLDLSTSYSNRTGLLINNENNNNEWIAGLTLTIPLFSGLSTYHSVQSGSALVRSAEYNRQSSDFDTIQQLEKAYFAYDEAVLKLKADLNYRAAITVQERIAIKQYNNGILNFQNWDSIEGNLIVAEKTALSSKRDREFAESNWRKTQGLGDLP